MIGKRIWKFVRQQIVSDVPAEMGACLECNTVTCARDKYDTCPYRLARIPTAKGGATADSEARTGS